MFSITKTYVDYNDVEKTETFWFNLNKTELSEIALGPSGGLDAMLQEISNSGDIKRIMDLVKSILLMSYGRKMPDGRFAKKDENGRRYADLFEESAAFDEIYMDLFTDIDSLIAFVNGVVPNTMKDAMKSETEKAMPRIVELQAMASAN